MHLADALLVWLDANKRLSDLSETSNGNIVNLMEQVMFRFCYLCRDELIQLIMYLYILVYYIAGPV